MSDALANQANKSATRWPNRLITLTAASLFVAIIGIIMTALFAQGGAICDQFQAGASEPDSS